MKKKNNGAVKALVLAVIVGIPLMLWGVSTLTSTLAEVAPLALIAVIVVFAAIYTAVTAKLLYDFYDVEAPWYRWVPCYGELTLGDARYVKYGSIAYAIAVAFFGLSRLPYSITKVLGGQLATDLPFYMTIVAFAALLVVQIIKGISLIDCTKTVAEEWERVNHTDAGFIKRFAFLGFLPFVRVLAIYGLNKPLTSMVTFEGRVFDDDEEAVLIEE